MWIKAMKEFMETCPEFLGRSMNINYLGHKEGDLSIDPMGESRVVRKYCDGKRVMEEDFCISRRCGFDENTSLNLKDAEFMEKVALWIDAKNSTGTMPVLDAGYVGVLIDIKKMPHLYESSIQGARMQMVLTFTYKEI